MDGAVRRAVPAREVVSCGGSATAEQQFVNDPGAAADVMMARSVIRAEPLQGLSMNIPTLILAACTAALGMVAAGGVNNCGAGIATLDFRGLHTQRHIVLVDEMRAYGRVDAEPRAGGNSAHEGAALPAIPAVILTL
jgi:hypothetical protein